MTIRVKCKNCNQISKITIDEDHQDEHKCNTCNVTFDAQDTAKLWSFIDNLEVYNGRDFKSISVIEINYNQGLDYKIFSSHVQAIVDFYDSTDKDMKDNLSNLIVEICMMTGIGCKKFNKDSFNNLAKAVHNEYLRQQDIRNQLFKNYLK